MTGDAPVLWHQSGINSKGEPFVQLILGEKIIAQVDPTEAREHAMAMIECAEAAETDAFIFRWVIEHVGADPGNAAGLLVDLRKFRAEVTGKHHGPTSSTDWLKPEGKQGARDDGTRSDDPPGR
jgi:hypothetical protein